MWPDFQKKILIFKDWTRIGFQGGSDENMRRMWLGLGNVVIGLPPLD